MMTTAGEGDGDGGSGLEDGERGLPILKFERDIVETVRQNEVTVVIGETGSGKTTQLAQMLLDSSTSTSSDLSAEGGSMIAVTQPRRVAAVTVARRVAWERGVRIGDEVGYSVRFEEFSSSKTRIKYLTDGVLLRETLKDPLLSKYGVVILDEAHERSLNTDILFGLLKTILVKRRKGNGAKDGNGNPLGPLKLLVTSATLQGEKFSQYFFSCPVFKVPGRCFPVEVIHLEEAIPTNTYVDYALETVVQIHLHEREGDVLVFLTGQAEIEKAIEMLNQKISELEEGTCSDLLILPLYAALPPEKQAKVFSKAAPGCRKCIIATNIAETSLTVDGIRYVVDTGFVKQKQYDPHTGLDSLKVCKISKVQAVQRAGRAGRTRPGKCYRLYTKENFELDMDKVSLPEICRISLVGAVLHLKSLVDVDVLEFDFLDRPEPSAIVDALKQLYVIEAIDADGKITTMGMKMAQLPLDPPLARAVIAARDLGCLRELLTIASMLSADRIFLDGGPAQRNEKPKALERLEKEGQGDHILLLRVFNLWKYDQYRDDTLKSLRLSFQGMRFAKEVRKQLSASVQESKDSRRGDGVDVGRESESKRHKVDEHPLGPRDTSGVRKALTVGFANRLAKRHPNHNGYRTMNENSVLAQLHPSCSYIVEDEDGLLPSWVVYHELLTTSRPFLSKVCPTQANWVDGILHRIETIDVARLRGGRGGEGCADAEKGEKGGNGKPRPGAQSVKQDEKAIDAARLRFLERKRKRMMGKNK